MPKFKKINNDEDTPNLVFIILLSLGVSIMLYPVISNYIYTNKYNNKITAYTNTSQEENKKRKEELLETAEKYNNELSSIKVFDIFKEKNNDISKEYANTLKVTGDGMMGYLEIPKIDIKLPIFHGTSEQVLQKGVGHLEGTSLPVGGENTHSVLTGHRGLPSSKLFTDINQMRKGDIFYIYILDNVLAYMVDKISVIEPNDLSELNIIDGGDYVTLMTCTPYGINTHRLLVRGKRIEYNIEYSKNMAKTMPFTISNILFYIGFNMVLALLIMWVILKKKIYPKKEIIYENINITKKE